MVFKPQRSAESIAVVFVKRCNEVYLPLYLPSSTVYWIHAHDVLRCIQQRRNTMKSRRTSYFLFCVAKIRIENTEVCNQPIQLLNQDAMERKHITAIKVCVLCCPSFKQFLAQVLLFACTRQKMIHDQVQQQHESEITLGSNCARPCGGAFLGLEHRPLLLLYCKKILHRGQLLQAPRPSLVMSHFAGVKVTEYSSRYYVVSLLHCSSNLQSNH